MSTNAPFRTNNSRARADQGPGRVALASSILLHGLLVAVIIFGGSIGSKDENASKYRVYKVSLYSPPPQVAGEPAAVAPRPAIVKPKIAEAPPKKSTVKQPVVKTTASRPSASKPKAAPVAGRNPKAGSPGGEGLNVQMEGEEFPYPEYLENVIIQLNRYFRWTGAGNLEAHVGFNILQDGSVRALKVERRSGNFNFDKAALEAVEEAAKRNAFGPLPEGFKRETLPILFKFIPPN